MTVDNFRTSDDADTFLRRLGLTVKREVVDQVILVIQGDSDRFHSLYEVYEGLKLPNGEREPPLCGKGTAYKIKAFYEKGLLGPYLEKLQVGGTSGVEPNGDTEPVNEVAAVESTGYAPTATGCEERKSPQLSRYDLASLLIKTPGVTRKKGSPTNSLAAFSLYWIVKARLENTSDRVITVGDFTLEVSRGDIYHVLPHLGSDVYGSRAQVPMPEETLGIHVALTTEKPVLIGNLRFIDDHPFGPGPVNLSLLAKG